MVNYPNGKRYIGPTKTANKSTGTSTSKEVKKRTAQPTIPKTTTSFSNRGMTLEEELNDSSAYYLEHDIAVIHKKPTPIQIVKVDYPKRSGAVIKEAYFKQASTTDYNGIYRGCHLDFEAKETKNKTSFPLSNFHEHQVRHMEKIQMQKGIAFVLVRFVIQDKTYLLDAAHVSHFWNNKDTERKSIPLQYFEEHGQEVKRKYRPSLDYISAIQKEYNI